MAIDNGDKVYALQGGIFLSVVSAEVANTDHGGAQTRHKLTPTSLGG